MNDPTRRIIAGIKTNISRTLLFTLFLIATSVVSSAQHSLLIPVTDSLQPLSAQQTEEEEFIKPSRLKFTN